MTEQLDVNSEGATGFKWTFYKEYNLFERFTRDLAYGSVSYSNTAKDYIGLSAISSGTAITYAAIATLASLAILSSFIAIGVALAATFIGIGVGAGFIYYRHHVKKKKCIDAINFIESNQMVNTKTGVDKVEDISDKIANQFSDYLNHCTDKEAHEFARKAQRLMADAIIERKVKEPMELASPAFMLQYQKLIPIVAPKPKFSFINMFQNLKLSIVERWRGKKKQENSNVSVTNAGLFSHRREQVRKPAHVSVFAGAQAAPDIKVVQRRMP